MRYFKTLLIVIIFIPLLISCGQNSSSTKEIVTTEQMYAGILFDRPADWVVSMNKDENSLMLESSLVDSDTSVIDIRQIKDLNLSAMEFAKKVQEEMKNASEPEEVTFGEKTYAKITITQNTTTHTYICSHGNDAYIFTYGNFENELSEGARIILSSVRFVDKSQP